LTITCEKKNSIKTASSVILCLKSLRWTIRSFSTS